MCGIIAAFNHGKKRDAVNEQVIDQFEDQKGRGLNGFGSLFFDRTGAFQIKRATEQAKALIDLYNNPSPMIIFHHRQPTSSDNKLKQTHPILISHGSLKHDYYIVHNGTIANHRERKEIIMKDLGITLSTHHPKKVGTWETEEWNDSEILGVDLARWLEKQEKKILCQGYGAFVLAQVNKKTNLIEQIHFGRTIGGDLNLQKHKGFFMLSSEGPGEEIKAETLYSFKLSDMRFETRAFKLAEAPKPAAVTVIERNHYTGYEGYGTPGRKPYYYGACHYEPSGKKIQTTIGFKTKEERAKEESKEEKAKLADALDRKIRLLRAHEYTNLADDFESEAQDIVTEAEDQINEHIEAYTKNLTRLTLLKTIDDKAERNKLMRNIAQVIVNATRECYNTMIVMVDEALKLNDDCPPEGIIPFSDESLQKLKELPEKLSAK